MSSHAEQHTLYQIANAPLREYPFPHLVVSGVFDPPYYDRLIENLLPAELMKPIRSARPVAGKYSDARYVFALEPEALAALPRPYSDFWLELAGWLLGGSFLEALLHKFQPQLDLRFAAAKPRIYREAMLVDDRSSYSLGPHSDSPNKVLTLLFYLPADASRPHLGTSIYVPRDRDFRCPGGPHYSREIFERVTTMPYLPNTLFAFFKTDSSFHGVEPIREAGDYRRHLLFYDVKCDLKSLAAQPAAPQAATAADSRPTIEFTF